MVRNTLCVIQLVSIIEVQTMIDENNVLKIGNNKATQWVVMHEDVAEKLAMHVRGKIHIEIFSATEPKDQ